MHIDTDEANAAELGKDASGELICDIVSGAGAQLKKTRGQKFFYSVLTGFSALTGFFLFHFSGFLTGRAVSNAN